MSMADTPRHMDADTPVPANSGRADQATGLPGLVFAMRYRDDIGFVWNTLGRLSDLVAMRLAGQARCFAAYPELTGNPAFTPQAMLPVAADFYDTGPASRARLDEVIRAGDVRTVVYNSCDPAKIDLPWLRSRGVRTVCFEHVSYPAGAVQPWWKSAAKRVSRRVLKRNIHDLYCANAHHQRGFLLDFAGLPAERLVTVVNGVDTEYFSPKAVDPASLGLPASDHYAVSICQSRTEKRIDFLLDVAAEVFRRHPDLSLTFVHVGDGPTLEADRAKAQALGLGRRFVFAGRQADVRPFHRLASFLVHTAERESFGLVLAEAMACGKPVVAADSPGPAEIVDQGVTGQILAQGDLAGFAEAVHRLATDAGLRRRWGEAARGRARATYSLERQAREFAQVLVDRDLA